MGAHLDRVLSTGASSRFAGLRQAGYLPTDFPSLEELARQADAGLGTATDSRQLLDSKVHSSLVVAYSRVRYTRVGHTLEYATPG